MSLQEDVRKDLVAMNGNKAKLMQHYSDEQRVMLTEMGGNVSDVPMDVSHPYHKLQDKIVYLGRMM